MMDSLKELLMREPFTPFRIVLTSGGAFEVLSPWQVAIGESQLNYYYPGSDRWAILRLNQIASFDIGDTDKPAGRRGRRRGQK